MSVFFNISIAGAQRFDGRQQFTITSGTSVAGDASIMVNTANFKSKAQLRAALFELVDVAAAANSLK